MTYAHRQQSSPTQAALLTDYVEHLPLNRNYTPEFTNWINSRRRTNMNEPKSLSKTAISKLNRDDLVQWANSRCLLEHLDTAEINDKTKGEVVNEIMSALLRAEVDEDHHAAATDTQARSTEELINGPKAAKKAPTRGRKPSGDLADKYASGTGAQKKALLVQLRDTDRMAWRDVAKTLGLGAPGPQGKFYGQPARTAYTKYVRPHTLSVVFQGVGRPTNGTTKPAPKPAARKTSATKAPAKRTGGTAASKRAARKAS